MSLRLDWKSFDIGGRVAPVVTGEHWDLNGDGDLVPTWSYDDRLDDAFEVQGDYLVPTNHEVIDDTYWELNGSGHIVPKAIP